jgi:hypothetical protein
MFVLFRTVLIKLIYFLHINSIIITIKSERLRWAEHVVYMTRQETNTKF